MEIQTRDALLKGNLDPEEYSFAPTMWWRRVRTVKVAQWWRYYGCGSVWGQNKTEWKLEEKQLSASSSKQSMSGLKWWVKARARPSSVPLFQLWHLGFHRVNIKACSMFDFFKQPKYPAPTWPVARPLKQDRLSARVHALLWLLQQHFLLAALHYCLKHKDIQHTKIRKYKLTLTHIRFLFCIWKGL